MKAAQPRLSVHVGFVSLETANRYAEITVRMKEAAMKLCEPPIVARDRGKAGWRDDAAY